MTCVMATPLLIWTWDYWPSWNCHRKALGRIELRKADFWPSWISWSLEEDSEAFCGHFLDPVRWKSFLATSDRVLAQSLFWLWPSVKNTRILPGTRQNDWAKIQLILAHSSWQPVKNTGDLLSLVAFWARGCEHAFWPDRFQVVRV